jgi:hypothetical protein
VKDEGPFICSFLTLQMALAPNTGHPTDMHYWFGRHGPDTGMLILDTPLSLGQAQWIRDQMSLDPLQKDLLLLKDHQLKDHPNALNREFHSSTITASTKASMTALAQKIKLIAALCGMRSSIVEAIRLTPLSYESWRGGSEYTDLQWINSFMVNSFEPYQAGRCLSKRSRSCLSIRVWIQNLSRGRVIFNWPIYKGI